MNEKLTTALVSGLAGATALTILHETVRRVRSDAPRMDTLGRRALTKGLDTAGLETPPENQLQAVALGGDVMANTLYYSLACLGKPSLGSRCGPGAAHGWAGCPRPERRSWGWEAGQGPARLRRRR